MKNLLPIFILFFLANCSTLHLQTKGGNDLTIWKKPFAGKWELAMNQQLVLTEFYAPLKDSVAALPYLTIISNPKINQLNRKGNKKGFWITSDSTNLVLGNYRKGKLHGRMLEFHGRIAHDGQYRNGKKYGWFIKYSGDFAYQFEFFVNGQEKSDKSKIIIINPNF